MKSIQTKIIFLILITVVVCTSVIGGHGVYRSAEVINREAVEIMNLLCENSAKTLDETFYDIEKSVNILAEYALDNLESMERLESDLEYAHAYVEKNEELGLTVVEETSGAVAVYVRINPEIVKSQIGYYKLKDIDRNVFEDCEMTDLTKYPEDDISHVGWYHQPVKSGKPIWMDAYYNANIDVELISYVVPLYVDDVLLGVVGMDINFDYITELADSIQIYETGSAFVMSENFVVLHQKGDKEIPTADMTGISQEEMEEFAMNSDSKMMKYKMNGQRKQMVLNRLLNGMYLGVTVPVSEINHATLNLVNQILSYSVVIGVIACIVGVFIARTMTRPIKELNLVAQEVAQGNYDVSIKKKTKDEIGELTDSLNITVKKLKRHMEYISGIAYEDGLTGIKNHMAYVRDMAELKDHLEHREVDFSIVVMDVNGLKDINDTHGHDAGNELIITAVNVISEVYRMGNIYRIGGDEFVAIIRETNRARCDSLEEELRVRLAECPGRVKPVVAVGTAIFHKGVASDFDDVFRRADERMYENKKKLKENGINSRYVQ